MLTKDVKSIDISTPAKINLFLKITGKRPDDYHELVSLMSCVGLYDRLRFDFQTEHIEVKCDHPAVPDGAGNLAHRAVQRFFAALDQKTDRNAPCKRGVAIWIEKKIPVGAGLGGGSSNAAAVLNTLNQYWEQPFSIQELVRMGLELGADVPFFVYRRPAVVRGIGEKLSPYPHRLPALKVLLVFPGFAVSTASVYKNLNFGLTNSKINPKYSNFKTHAFSAARDLSNDLEAVTIARHPLIRSIKNKMLDLAADGALMSGSGPTVFGLFSNSVTALKAYAAFESEKNRGWSIELVDLIGQPLHANGDRPIEIDT